jgi:hypothetical protein
LIVSASCSCPKSGGYSIARDSNGFGFSSNEFETSICRKWISLRAYVKILTTIIDKSKGSIAQGVSLTNNSGAENKEEKIRSHR